MSGHVGPQIERRRADEAIEARLGLARDQMFGIAEPLIGSQPELRKLLGWNDRSAFVLTNLPELTSETSPLSTVDETVLASTTDYEIIKALQRDEDVLLQGKEYVSSTRVEQPPFTPESGREYYRNILLSLRELTGYSPVEAVHPDSLFESAQDVADKHNITPYAALTDDGRFDDITRDLYTADEYFEYVLGSSLSSDPVSAALKSHASVGEAVNALRPEYYNGISNRLQTFITRLTLRKGAKTLRKIAEAESLSDVRFPRNEQMYKYLGELSTVSHIVRENLKAMYRDEMKRLWPDDSGRFVNHQGLAYLPFPLERLVDMAEPLTRFRRTQQ